MATVNLNQHPNNMAETDILTELQKEWTGKQTAATVETLNGLSVKVSPLTWTDKQLLFSEGEKAWPKLVIKLIKREGGEPLFAPHDELKRTRNIEKILTNQVNPSVLQELIGLLLPQQEVEDIDKGKPSSKEEALEST